MKLHFAKLFTYLFTLWLTVTLNFLVPRLLPGDPILSLIDASDGASYDEAVRKQLESYHGLDQPLGVQYVHYWQNLLRGDLGDSISFRKPVSELVLARLPWTLGLVLPSLVISSLIGLVAGTHAGWRRGSSVDRGDIDQFVEFTRLLYWVCVDYAVRGLSAMVAIERCGYPICPVRLNWRPGLGYVQTLAFASRHAHHQHYWRQVLAHAK